jgi:hypothetical protein
MACNSQEDKAGRTAMIEELDMRESERTDSLRPVVPRIWSTPLQNCITASHSSPAPRLLKYTVTSPSELTFTGEAPQR